MTLLVSNSPNCCGCMNNRTSSMRRCQGISCYKAVLSLLLVIVHGQPQGPPTRRAIRSEWHEKIDKLASETLHAHHKIVPSSRDLREAMVDEHAAFFAPFDSKDVDDEQSLRTINSTGNQVAADTGKGRTGPIRRELLKTAVSVRPRFDPPPGRYWTAVGVALLGNPGDEIVYTLSSLNSTGGNTSSTLTVPSGTIVHLSRTSTLHAYTLGHNASTSTNSPTVSGTYHVPSRQFGTAYLAPYHNAGPAYSGKLVRVELRTDVLSQVRIHNVLTDFADYYSFRGQAPHKIGQLHVNDLQQIHPDLVGFQGAFSGSCGGQAYGFLSPFFDGDSYSGKAVRIRDEHFLNATAGSQCSGSPGEECAVTVLDLTKVDSRLAGFAGGFVADCYAYFVPYFNGYEFASQVVRVHVQNFTLGNVSTIDLRTRDSQLAGFFGGFAHKGYGYLAPFRNVFGPVGQSNTRFTCDGFKHVDMTLTQATNGGDHLIPNMFGKFVRFKLDNFSSHNVDFLDLTTYDPDLRGFSGAFSVGNQAILVPYRNRERANNQGFFSKVVKVDLDDFRSVEIMDLSHRDQALRGFMGGFAYGKYALLVPYSNGRVGTNWQGRAEFGTVVRIDVNDFSIDRVKTIDLTTIKRQQVPDFALPQLRGFVQGFASGRHAFFVPYFNGVRSGLLTRVDMADFELLADLQAAGNDTGVYNRHDGIQVVDLSLFDKGLVGFSGGALIPEQGWA